MCLMAVETEVVNSWRRKNICGNALLMKTDDNQSAACLKSMLFGYTYLLPFHILDNGNAQMAYIFVHNCVSGSLSMSTSKQMSGNGAWDLRNVKCSTSISKSVGRGCSKWHLLLSRFCFPKPLPICFRLIKVSIFIF